MTPRVLAVWLLTAWLAANCAWSQTPRLMLVGDEPLINVETLRDARGNLVRPIRPGESDSATIAQATVNTRAINLFFSKFGSAKGETRGLSLNGRLYAINDTILDGPVSNAWVGYGPIIIDGGGGQSWTGPALDTIRFNASTFTGTAIQSVGGFVWVGNAANGNRPYTDRSMLKIRGFGARVEHCYFMGWHKATQRPGRPARLSDMVLGAIEITRASAIPSGKHAFNSNSFGHCQTCYRLTGKIHADNCDFAGKHLMTECGCFLRGEGNDQAVGYRIANLEVNAARFEPIKVSSFDTGGKVHVDTLKMVARGTVFETDRAAANHSDFSCDRVWWDQNALATDGGVSAHTSFNKDGSPYSASTVGTAATDVLRIEGGLVVEPEDVGKKLWIEAPRPGNPRNENPALSTNFVVNNFQANPIPYTVISVDQAQNAWTLDRPCTNGRGPGSLLKGHLGEVAHCRFVDMHKPGSAYFDISGHLSTMGRGLPNMVRVLGPDAHVRLHVHNAHRAMQRAYDPHVSYPPARPFLPRTDHLQFFLDVEEQVIAGGVDYRVTPSHDMVADPVDGVTDASAARNDLAKFSNGSRPTIGAWKSLINQKRSLHFLGGKGLKHDSPSSLSRLSSLSVGGVFRLSKPVRRGATQTICGVWQESGNQRCWRIGVKNVQQLFLELSTGGNSATTTRYALDSATVEVDRAAAFYAVWNSTQATVDVWLDGAHQRFAGTASSPLHDSIAPFAVGCAGSNPVDGLVGDIAILMIDDAALSTTEIEYRAEEFAARRGTFLNTNIDGRR